MTTCADAPEHRVIRHVLSMCIIPFPLNFSHHSCVLSHP